MGPTDKNTLVIVDFQEETGFGGIVCTIMYLVLQFPYQLIFPFEGNNGFISLRFRDISPA